MSSFMHFLRGLAQKFLARNNDIVYYGSFRECWCVSSKEELQKMKEIIAEYDREHPSEDEE